MIPFQFYSRIILKPILKNPKCAFLYTLANNWSNIIISKYLDYCKLEKVTLNKEKKQGNVYMITYNSATSFYINNNKEYIIEKMNCLFGYKAVLKLYVKEVPTVVKKKEKIKINTNFSLKNENINSELKSALEELGSTIYV